MKYLCDACNRLVEAGNFTVEGDRLVLVCPDCGERSFGGAAAGEAPGREPAPVLCLARPPPAPEGPLCPKCGAARPAERDSCARCGLVFALFNPENLALPEEIEALWAAAEASWSEPSRHEAFLDACTRAQALPEAVRRYRVAAELNPSDPIATCRRDEIVSRLLALSLPWVGLPRAEKPKKKTRPLAILLTLLAFGGLIAAAAWLMLTLSPRARF